MAKKYDNDFKVMIVELLGTGRKVKEISVEYIDGESGRFGRYAVSIFFSIIINRNFL